MSNKTVSIIIVTWNSAKYLPRCFDSLSRQTFTDYEILVIDNGSKDCEIENLCANWPKISVHVERLPDNLGFAVANNIGARLARGKWLALLNADAFPEPDWLERLLAAAKTHPNAFFSSRQIQANTPYLLDGEGDAYHISGLAWRRNYGFPVYTIDRVEEVFGACGAAAMYPRQAFINAGGFDEDFFAYHEDVDLSFRLRLRGFHCFYIPQAVVYHVGSASIGRQSEFAIYHGRRNLIWTYMKNMPTLMFWLFLPFLLVANIFTFIVFAFTGQGKVILRAQMDAMRGLSFIARKRKQVQRNCHVSFINIVSHMEWNLFAPFGVLIQRRRYKSDIEWTKE